MKRIIRAILVLAILATSMLSLFACDEGGNASGEKGLIYKRYAGENFWTIQDYVDEDGVTELNIDPTKDGIEVGRIAAGAFDGCQLEKITIPTTVKEMGAGAFKNSPKLKELTIPFVGRYFFAFSQSAGNSDIESGYDKPVDGNYDNVQASIAERTIWYLFGTEAFDGGLPLTANDSTVIYMPSTLSKITVNPKAGYNLPISAFHGLKSVDEIVLNNVKAIGESAFENVVLDKLVVPSTVENVYAKAFAGSDIVDLSFAPNTLLKELGEKAFTTSKIKNITLPNAIETIGERCFEKCSSLKTVTLPKTINKIGYAAFNNCAELTTVTVAGATEQTPVALTIEGHAFYKCVKLSAPVGGECITVNLADNSVYAEVKFAN